MLRPFLLYLFVLYLATSIVNATSRQPPPLKRLAHPDAVSLQILPRNPLYQSKRRSIFDIVRPGVQHDDALRITVRIYSDRFHLHLRPNDELIHPSARITHLKPSLHGSVVHKIEPLRREDILVYGGDVVDDLYTDKRLDEDYAGGVQGGKNHGVRGWARIMLLDGGYVDEAGRGRAPVFEGAFSVDGVIHHVLTRENYINNMLPGDPYPDSHEDLVIFRDTDMASPLEAEHIRTGKSLSDLHHDGFQNPQTCAHDKLRYNVDVENNPVLRFGAGMDRQRGWFDPFGFMANEGSLYGGLEKRQGDIGGGANATSNFIDTIGQIQGCPTTQQIVYMGVVSDCTYTQANGGNANATQNILRNFNTVSLLYKSTFNISLGIVDLQISDAECPANDANNPWNIACGSTTLNDRLSLFSAWRGQRFSALSDPNTDPTGLYHLMSGCPSGTEVGVAWLGTVCQRKASGNSPSVVSGTGVSTAGRTEWQVVAHEIGHNLGAIHDCTDGCGLTDNCCPLNSDACSSDNQFLMNPTSSSSEQSFSPCTIGNICSLYGSSKIDTSCIQAPSQSQRTFSLQMCGNGILEAGEECDPGSGSNSTCCDPTTCKLRQGALCDPFSSSCCTAACGLAPRGMVCRPKKDTSCDFEEVCDGTTSECPADKTAPNGQSCGANGLACANGACTSIDQQCQTVGASLNLTKACSTPDDTCQVSCADPKNPNQCIVLNSQLVDGSPCGYGGTCLTGKCKSGTFFQAAIAWYTKNLQISIPVSVVVGILLLIIMYWIFTSIRSSCKKKPVKKGALTTSAIPPGTPAQRIPDWAPGESVTRAAGPFDILPPRVDRLGSISTQGSTGARKDDRLADWRRPSETSTKVKPSNPRKQQYPQQPSYAQGANNMAGVGRRLMEDRSQWVDERQYNGPRS